MKLFKQTVAFDYSKAPNKHDYVLWGIQARLSLWRIRLGVFGGLLLVIVKSYFEFRTDNIEFLLFSDNYFYDYSRFLAIIVVGLAYLVCLYSVFMNQRQQDFIFKEAVSNGTSK